MRMFVRPHLSEGHATLLSPDSDGGSGAAAGGAGEQSPTLAPPAGADVDALRSKLATYEKAEADRKAADHQRTTAETERARKAGEYDKVIGAQTEELTALKARQQIGRAHV